MLVVNAWLVSVFIYNVFILVLEQQTFSMCVFQAFVCAPQRLS